jgi:hypothetical protein
MGIVNFGIPEKDVEFIKSNMELTIFVEGGTYLGGTARKMCEIFSSVITIEKSEKMYEQARNNLQELSNVCSLFGDTREHLINILKENDDILFWLDAHWSGGNTYGKHDECPLLKELEIIFEVTKYKNIAILIDDARLFLAPPPLPHKITQWPTISDLNRMLPVNWGMICYKDVIYLLPENNLHSFREYLQPKITKVSKARGNVKPMDYVKKILNKSIGKSH